MVHETPSQWISGVGKESDWLSKNESITASTSQTTATETTKGPSIEAVLVFASVWFVIIVLGFLALKKKRASRRRRSWAWFP